MAISPKKIGGPIKRIASIDMSTAQAVLKAAMTLIVPDDLSQRKALSTLMPYLYVLRNKGCSWSQLTMLINDCGFDLQPASVRTYYGEMLAERQDKFQEQMNEQILLLAEVKKVTKNAEVSDMAERALAVMARQQTAAASKLNDLFGGGSSATPVAQSSAGGSVEAAKPLLVGNKNSGLRPAPANAPSAEIAPPSVPSDDFGSFGLLNLKPGEKKTAASKAPAFFGQDDSTPVVPDIQFSKTASENSENKSSGLRHSPESQPVESISQNTASPASSPVSLRCLALKDGIKPLEKRERTPQEAYLPGDLEHPHIPGLMLSLEERLYSAALEYVDESGEIKLETLDEKRFRVLWKRPIPMTISKSGENFTKIDFKAFEKAKP